MRKKSSAAKVKGSTTAVTSDESSVHPAATSASASEPSASTDGTATPAQTTYSKQYLWVEPELIPGHSPKDVPIAALVVPKMEEDPASRALADTPAHWSSASPSSSTSSQSDETQDPGVKGKHIISPIIKPKSEDGLVVRRSSVKRAPWTYGPDTTIQSVSSDSRFFFDHCMLHLLLPILLTLMTAYRSLQFHSVKNGCARLPRQRIPADGSTPRGSEPHGFTGRRCSLGIPPLPSGSIASNESRGRSAAGAV